LRRASALLACAAIALGVGLPGGGTAGGGRFLDGDPAAGELVFAANNCGFCHTFTPAGSKGPTAPDLDWSLRADAPRTRLTQGLLALSRIDWGGRSMPSFKGALDAQQTDDLVAFLIGRSFTAPAQGVAPVSSFRVAPVPADQPKLVARWVRVGRLPKSVVPGAKLFAKVACLSCHTYRGDGVRSLGGPDLTRIGAKRKPSYLAAYVRNPRRYGNRTMPAYADLSKADLARLAAFLVASTGR